MLVVKRHPVSIPRCRRWPTAPQVALSWTGRPSLDL